jgi:RNA recognition motif-containing protein
MGNRLYVGNLSFNTTEADLRNEFGKCGSVTDVKIVTDRESGRSRGFGFVQYTTEGEATAAIQAFHGASIGGRSLTVNVAEDRRPNNGGTRSFGGGGQRPLSGGGGGYGGGGGGGGDRGRSGGGRGGKGSRRRREDSDWG